MKKVLAFDLDGTLAPSKSTLPPLMGTLLTRLLQKYELCVISGGKMGQFRSQLLDGLKAEPTLLQKLHLMPTCGTQYYRYCDNDWQQVYAENFTDTQKQQIITALQDGIAALGFEEPIVYGETIEDRGSQITFSALGQDVVAKLGDEGVRLKESWDPDGSKKDALRDYVSKRIPEFEVHVGGGTSIDITQTGIDKAYGIQKLIELLHIKKEDILFFGDQLTEGGNDFPVKRFGVESVAVKNWQDTAQHLQHLLASE